MKNLGDAIQFIRQQRALNVSYNEKIKAFDELDLHDKMRLANKYFYKGAYYHLCDNEKVIIINKIIKE